MTDATRTAPRQAPRHAHSAALDAVHLRSAIEFDSSDQIDFHVHDTTELCFVRRGVIAIECAGAIFEGKPGTLYVLPSGVPHSQRCRAHWRTQCVLLGPTRGFFDERARTLDLSADDLFARWFDDLCSLSSRMHTPRDPVADALLMTLIARLQQAEAAEQLVSALHPALARAVAFLEANLARDVDAHELAKSAGASHSHLRLLFRQRFGHGPLRHHTLLRMRLAQKLLLNPYVRVHQVADELGYADTNYFVRVFHKSVGRSPRAWRTAQTDTTERQ